MRTRRPCQGRVQGLAAAACTRQLDPSIIRQPCRLAFRAAASGMPMNLLGTARRCCRTLQRLPSTRCQSSPHRHAHALLAGSGLHGLLPSGLRSGARAVDTMACIAGQAPATCTPLVSHGASPVAAPRPPRPAHMAVPQNISNFLWAFAKLELRNHDLFAEGGPHAGHAAAACRPFAASVARQGAAHVCCAMTPPGIGPYRAGSHLHASCSMQGFLPSAAHSATQTLITVPPCCLPVQRGGTAHESCIPSPPSPSPTCSGRTPRWQSAPTRLSCM